VPTRLETEGLKISPGTPGRLQGRFSSTVSSDTTGAGAGGNVTLIAPQIVIDDGGRVTANSSGAGTAGSLFVTANPGWLRVYDGFITTRAESSDGGNITMVAGHGVRLKGAEISTSVGGGSGSGGNISIDPPFVILQDARVAANALAGAGGNITLIGDYFFITPGSTIEASSQLGLPGRVQISALQNHAVSGLPALSAQFFDATGLLREACTGRGGSVSSRLVDVGRGGVTGTPSSYASSRYFHDEPVPAPQASERGSMTRSAQPERSVLLAGICPF
jgi:hypothetical protein